jgi:hypothetical protein
MRWWLVWPALFLSTYGGCGAFNLAVKVEMCRSRQAEARSNLLSIMTVEREFHGRSGRYSDSLRELGFHAEPRRAYILGFSTGGADAVYLPDRPRRVVRESDLPQGLSAGKDHFRVGAAGHPNSRSDELDVWIIDETGQLQHPKNPCVWTRFHMFGEG